MTVFANKVLKENLSKNFDTTIAVNSDQFYLQDFYTHVFSLNSFYSGTVAHTRMYCGFEFQQLIFVLIEAMVNLLTGVSNACYLPTSCFLKSKN